MSGLGMQAFSLAAVDTVRNEPIGTVCRGFEDVLNVEGEFIYLPGAAGVVAGDVVAYDLLPRGAFVTRATNAAFVNSAQPLAVALTAIPAGSFGWYQISGVATVNVTAASAAGRMFLTATAGQVNSAALAGSAVLGARLSTAIGVPGVGQSYATITRPSVQSQIT